MTADKIMETIANEEQRLKERYLEKSRNFGENAEITKTAYNEWSVLVRLRIKICTPN